MKPRPFVFVLLTVVFVAGSQFGAAHGIMESAEEARLQWVQPFSEEAAQEFESMIAGTDGDAARIEQALERTNLSSTVVDLQAPDEESQRILQAATEEIGVDFSRLQARALQRDGAWLQESWALNFNFAVICGADEFVYIPVGISQRREGRPSAQTLERGEETMIGLILFQDGAAAVHLGRESGTAPMAETDDDYALRIVDADGQTHFEAEGSVRIEDPQTGEMEFRLNPVAGEGHIASIGERLAFGTCHWMTALVIM